MMGNTSLSGMEKTVVEAGVYDSPRGTAPVSANFTYERIENPKVRLLVSRPVKTVTSHEHAKLRFSPEAAGSSGHPPGCPRAVTFALNLGLNGVVVLKQATRQTFTSSGGIHPAWA